MKEGVGVEHFALLIEELVCVDQQFGAKLEEEAVEYCAGPIEESGVEVIF